MDNRSEVRDFLTTRRERLTPEQAGVPFFGGRRRVKGLRREEVAMLAGMSTDYYTRLERGNLTGVSHSVLEALARALRLDEAERTHLLDLAETANTPTAGRTPRRVPNRTTVRQGVQRILDTINAPAYARNGRMDILATNRLGRALFADALGTGDSFNLARYLFLDPRAQDFYPAWPTVAADCVAALRTYAGRNPYDRALTDLIGELSTRSEPFRTWWATHNVKLHHTATKTMHHALAGDLELTGEALQLPGDPDLTIITYTFDPSGPTEQALAFLASWSARSTGDPDDQPARSGWGTASR
ncbi:helix-turn-helix domain-containing protein [Catellatospora citrea]|uniref:Transcriptional regulator n=1 Tax=Catellatospora citrea TaxID=53366 RepID=A0A8J3KN54_9ACTN|nr:helix-turn-helix transcriptional regulator [Catellatospora citrea]RKE12096.1 transcriptional regulator with XRE-family HTH domain [Catellatospora citrea]GIF98944.1 transcriptional regulator [Catellatospora citrea]